MHISVSEDKGTRQLTVTLSGALDETEALALADRILNLLPMQLPELIVVDVHACTVLSNQGFSALVSLALAPELERSRLRVTGHSAEAAERMRRLKLDRIFEFETLQSETTHS